MRYWSQIRRFDKLNLMTFQYNNRTPRCRVNRQRAKNNATPSHHRYSLAFLAALVLKFSAFGLAASMFDDSLAIEEVQFNHGCYNVSSATLALDVTEPFGETVIANRFEWEAGPNTPEDCLPGQRGAIESTCSQRIRRVHSGAHDISYEIKENPHDPA